MKTKILRRQIYETSGNLTDHYDPSKKLIKLSEDIYNGTSIASAASVLFQLVTLPVEINASRRAHKQLEELNLVYSDEENGIKKVLSVAAMTYIASLLSSILNLLRLVLMLTNRNDD